MRKRRSWTQIESSMFNNYYIIFYRVNPVEYIKSEIRISNSLPAAGRGFVLRN